jgi:hypothetical protein
MQILIPVAYNAYEVKTDNINHCICVGREEFVSWDSILKLQDKSRTSFIVRVKTTERSDCIWSL